MAVLVAPPNPFVYKTLRNERIGIDQVAPVNNDGMLTVGQEFDLLRIESPVLVVGGEDRNRISTGNHLIDVLRYVHSVISCHIGIVHPYRCPRFYQEVPEWF